MKKFEQLSKEEKEKLQTYLLIALNTNIFLFFGILLSSVFLIPGFILISLSQTFRFAFTGATLMVMGVAVVFVFTFIVKNLEKKIFLTFEIKDSFKDVFKIADTDLSKVKYGLYIKEEK